MNAPLKLARKSIVTKSETQANDVDTGVEAAPIWYVPKAAMQELAATSAQAYIAIGKLALHEFNSLRRGEQNEEYTFERLEEFARVRAHLQTLELGLDADLYEETFIGWPTEAEAHAGKLAEAVKS